MKVVSVREVSALLLSALIPGMALGAIGVASGNLREAIWTFPLAATFAVPIAMLVALPAVILLNTLRAYSLSWYLLIGFFAGTVLACYLILPNTLKTDWRLGWPSYAAQYFILLVLSLAASAFDWFVARPDKIHAL